MKKLKLKGEFSNSNVSIVLTNDVEIADLNRRFLNKNSATDVLAFSMDDEGLLGEVIVSVDTARKQAQARNVNIHDELILLSLHGILHLTGLKDDTLKYYCEMRSAEFKNLLEIL
ncbi:MAG: rRNA maturation RNase YbeY [archaeon]